MNDQLIIMDDGWAGPIVMAGRVAATLPSQIENQFSPKQSVAEEGFLLTIELPLCPRIARRRQLRYLSLGI